MNGHSSGEGGFRFGAGIEPPLAVPRRFVHAVDLEAARAWGSVGVERLSVCRTPCTFVDNGEQGAFPYGAALSWGDSSRCERCGWVVALNRGAVDAEIEFYADGSRVGVFADPLRQLFTAILADAPPGPTADLGYRSELLAHVARHRPVIDLEGELGALPAYRRVPLASSPLREPTCLECTFAFGYGSAIAVPAPCSALTAVAHHYGIAGQWAAAVEAIAYPDNAGRL